MWHKRQGKSLRGRTDLKCVNFSAPVYEDCSWPQYATVALLRNLGGISRATLRLDASRRATHTPVSLDCMAEDLVGSAFYQALKRAYPNLHERAAARDWTVVVPAQWPQGAPLARDVLESHLLQPSPYFLGAFITINGRSVEMSDDERSLIPREGWRDGAVTARVVSRDSVYSSAFKAVAVLRVDRLLTGGVTGAPQQRQVKRGSAGSSTTRAVIGLDGASDTAAAMRILRAENAAAVSWLDEALAEFNERYVSVGGFETYTAGKLSVLLDGALTRLAERNPEIGGDSEALRSAALVLEAHILSACCEKTLGVVRTAYRQSDTVVAARCEQLSASTRTVSELLSEGTATSAGGSQHGAAQGRTHEVSEAVLSEVVSFLTAMEAEGSSARKKAALASAAWKALSSGCSGDGALDEILPMWLFCISRSGCKHLASDTAYIKAFGNLFTTPSLSAISGGGSDAAQHFVIVNLDAAVRFFQCKSRPR